MHTGLTIWQHPSFFAYFATSSTFEGILGDLYASALPNPGFNVRNVSAFICTSVNPSIQWDCSPACTELEAVVMDWSAKLFGLDEIFLNEKGVGGGVLQVSIERRL